MSSRRTAVSGVLLVLLDRGGQQAVHFFVTVLLARILVPEDFGLIAMVAIPVSIGQVLVDGGFGLALIQKQVTTREEESSVFFLNLICGCSAALLVYLVAPALAAFFDDERLRPLLQASSVILIINALAVVHVSLLTQSLDFKTQLKVSFAAVLSSGIIGVAMAHLGFGVWSLVGQQIGFASVRASLLWVLHSWRPIACFRPYSLRGLFGYGSKLLASNVLDVAFLHVHLLAIGKIFSAADVGFYSRAQGLQGLIARDVSTSVGKVAFPLFSAISGDVPRLRSAALRAISIMTYVNFPLMFGLAVCAEPFVRILLTDKWLPLVPYLQAFCLIGLLNPIQTINQNTLKAIGRADLFLLLMAARKLLIIVALVCTYRFGVLAIILGQFAAALLDTALSSYWVSKHLRISPCDFVKSVGPGLFVSASMAIAVHAAGSFRYSSDWIEFGTMVVIGGVLLLLLSNLLKIRAYIELVEIAKSFRRVKQTSELTPGDSL